MHLIESPAGIENRNSGRYEIQVHTLGTSVWRIGRAGVAPHKGSNRLEYAAYLGSSSNFRFTTASVNCSAHKICALDTRSPELYPHEQIGIIVVHTARHVVTPTWVLAFRQKLCRLHAGAGMHDDKSFKPVRCMRNSWV